MKQKTPFSLYAYGTGIICKCERALAWVQRSKEHILQSFLFLGRRRRRRQQQRSNDWTRISTLRRRVKECARVTLWCLDNKCAKYCTEKYEHILTTLIYNITLPANNEATPWRTMRIPSMYTWMHMWPKIVCWNGQNSWKWRSLFQITKNFSITIEMIANFKSDFCCFFFRSKSCFQLLARSVGRSLHTYRCALNFLWTSWSISWMFR